MGDYKYPLIPKKYYAAVMFACKMIREHKTFNKSCEIAANYYKVDEQQVRKHVSARAAAGHKGVKQGKQYWFVVTKFHGSDASGFEEEGSKVVRGKSKATVDSRFLEESGNYNMRHDRNGSSYSWSEYFTVDGPYEKKADAQVVADKRNEEIRKKREEENRRYEIEQKERMERAKKERQENGKTYRFGTEQEKLQLTALLSGDPLSEGSRFAQRMLDRDWPGWRDTDLSLESVWALRYGKDGQAAKPSYASHFEHR